MKHNAFRSLLSAIKLAVDRNRQPGRFLLAGSANPLPRINESLAGRVKIAQLPPLTEAEKAGQAGGFVSALLEGAFRPGIGSRASVAGPTLAQRMATGGYFVALARSPVHARSMAPTISS